MKHSIPVKFIAIVLTALALFGSLVCGGGIIFLSAEGLYDLTPEEIVERQETDIARNLAWSLASDYAGRKLVQGPPDFVAHLPEFTNSRLPYLRKTYHLDDTKWSYTIRNDEGSELDGTHNALTGERSYTHIVTTAYPQYRETPPDEAYSTFSYEDPETGKIVSYCYTYEESPQLHVTVSLAPGAYRLESLSYDWFYRNLPPYGDALIGGLVLCLLAFAVGMVCLCCTAGR